MPWKNGGGSTTEVLVHPAGASLEDFEWRVSMAAVEQDGAFSAFPGIDRTLTLYGGPRMVLAFDGGRMIALTPQDPTIRFAGEAIVNAAVPEGAVGDFNVMTRRSRYHHLFERFAVASQTVSLSRVGSGTLLFLAAGKGMTCKDAAGNAATLGERDAVLLDVADSVTWQLVTAEPLIIFRVELFLLP
jgi:environmental stress-induced protein Ves